MEYFYNFIWSIVGYGEYLLDDILHPSLGSYFYWLIAISLFFWTLEYFIPWRKGQSIVRKDFWLDVFYMFFNFFIFYLIGFAGVARVGVDLFNDFLGLFGIENIVAIEINKLPSWLMILRNYT